MAEINEKRMSTDQIRCYHAINNWIHYPSITTFKKLYYDGFRHPYRHPFNSIYRIWRIFRNTICGRYTQILKQGYI
jgi:hypothetical protein